MLGHMDLLAHWGHERPPIDCCNIVPGDWIAFAQVRPHEILFQVTWT